MRILPLLVAVMLAGARAQQPSYPDPTTQLPSWNDELGDLSHPCGSACVADNNTCHWVLERRDFTPRTVIDPNPHGDASATVTVKGAKPEVTGAAWDAVDGDDAHAAAENRGAFVYVLYHISGRSCCDDNVRIRGATRPQVDVWWTIQSVGYFHLDSWMTEDFDHLDIDNGLRVATTRNVSGSQVTFSGQLQSGQPAFSVTLVGGNAAASGGPRHKEALQKQGQARRKILVWSLTGYGGVEVHADGSPAALAQAVGMLTAANHGTVVQWDCRCAENTAEPPAALNGCVSTHGYTAHGDGHGSVPWGTGASFTTLTNQVTQHHGGWHPNPGANSMTDRWYATYNNGTTWQTW